MPRVTAQDIARFYNQKIANRQQQVNDSQIDETTMKAKKNLDKIIKESLEEVLQPRYGGNSTQYTAPQPQGNYKPNIDKNDSFWDDYPDYINPSLRSDVKQLVDICRELSWPIANIVDFWGQGHDLDGRVVQKMLDTAANMQQLCDKITQCLNNDKNGTYGGVSFGYLQDRIERITKGKFKEGGY